ncbi:MerR-like DNA binding protein [Actinocorallia herbida]|uniref:MerR-like DNA binding protein n=1 Tax=Actinocorallia herbida TaxID=58109 RepID=A0A3N1D1Z2_9ACTN|nr:MerR family transcriptional regulator [Actinocorallia herbida]ROO87531.1 MerR-like DNA binding protein [Actinocorallia herbida]
MEGPIGCTLSAGAMKARLGEFEELFALALTRELRGDVEERARASLAAEAECCASVGFDLAATEEGLVVTAPAEVGAALDGLRELAEGSASAAQVAAASGHEGLPSGELAAGVDAQTLCHYERRSLLAEPERTLGGHRLHPVEAVAVLRVIKAAQRLGFTLEEVADLLEATGTAAMACPSGPA